VMVLAGAASARATTVDVHDGTLVVTGGDSASHEIRFRLSADQAADEVLDNQPITTTTCTPETTTKVVCPGSGNVKVDLGGGDDDVSFVGEGFDCFFAYELNLGDGANELYLSNDCQDPLTGPATVNAGSAPDILTGGSQGPFTFNAGGGNDSVYATPGDDNVHGGAGDDRLQGANGSDRIDGGSGTDQIYGDIASCTFLCSFGADTLFARDGEQDSVDCGGGADTAQVDQLDVVASCAAVDRQTAAAPPGDGGGGELGAGGGGLGAGGGSGDVVAKASFAGSKKTVKVSRRGRFSYSFKATAGLRGKAAFRKLGAKSFTVPFGGKVTVKMRLTRAKLALLRRTGRIKTRVTVTLRNAAGASSVASAPLTLKR